MNFRIVGSRSSLAIIALVLAVGFALVALDSKTIDKNVRDQEGLETKSSFAKGKIVNKTVTLHPNKSMLPDIKGLHEKEYSTENSSLPFCQKMVGKITPPISALDVPGYISIFQDPDVRTNLTKGIFPTTAFTPHVNQIVRDYRPDNADHCKQRLDFRVQKPFDSHVQVQYIRSDSSNNVFEWWRNIAASIFGGTTSPSAERRALNFSSPVLPGNLSLVFHLGDSTQPNFVCQSPDKRRWEWTALASSSPQGRMAFTNFLEAKRLVLNVKYPTVPWEDRCTIPIWRGNLWIKLGPNEEKNNVEFRNVVERRPFRLKAVSFSFDNPDLLDARVSKERFPAWWDNRTQNGFDKAWRSHFIPQEQYYTHFQSALVLCGIGAAFRTSIHMSTETAVVVQECPEIEWFQPYMTPWKHYIPLQHTLNDLQERMEWIRLNPEKVREIALNGRQFYEDFLSFPRKLEHYYELLYRLSLAKIQK